ncbi:hypothetical protein MRB53_022236 [Persea americana]|uniref:Uncharacterized protein n=1 Tax=Persea americana TaxID=3435 RepID=A0ACC2L6J7_PERAE|nr:hypothetical protein MRB53_022236 [Persea americana]
MEEDSLVALLFSPTMARHQGGSNSDTGVACRNSGGGGNPVMAQKIVFFLFCKLCEGGELLDRILSRLVLDLLCWLRALRD